MKKPYILFTCILYCFHFSVYSQTEIGVNLGPNTTGPSPNSSSLGEYADVPVSLYTGVPDISLPIYNVKSGSLSLPISLSYHAQGVRVEEVASDVGLGWALNAGGAITRAVKGLPDDWAGYIPTGDPCNFAGSGEDIAEGYLTIGTNINWTASPVSADAQYPNGFLLRNAFGAEDYEPDMFYFNFSGYSGQFVFDRSGVPHMLSQSAFSIQPIYTSIAYGSSGHYNSITGFTIIAPDGTKFYFNDAEVSTTINFHLWVSNGGTAVNLDPDPYYSFYENLMTYSNFYNGHGIKIFNSAWYLSKIESPTSTSTITLTYTDTKQVYLSGLSQNGRPNVYTGATNYSGTPYKNASYVATHIAGKSLSKISFIDGEVDFTYATLRQDVGGLPLIVSSALSTFALSTTNTYALSDISIKTLALNTIKEYQLGYSYFQSTNTISANSSFNTRMACYLKRLKLQTVQEISPVVGVTPKPAHQFVYDETNPLPYLFSFQQDYWGYYNGNTAATSLLPITYYHPNNNPSALYGSRLSIYPWSSHSGEIYLNGSYQVEGHHFSDRSPNATYMKSGSLTKIIYPTGGETSFIYEPNDFYLDGQNRIGGGLRIKTQTTYDGADHTKDIIKNYSYKQITNNTLSSGKVFYLPQFCRDVFFSPTTYQRPSDVYSNSLCQLGATNGNVVGYTDVTTDFNGIGKTISTFAVPAAFGIEQDGCTTTCLYNRTHSVKFSTNSDPDDYPFASNPNYDFARGSLLEEKVYNSSNVLVKHTVNEYKVLSTDANISALKVALGSVSDCSTWAGYACTYARYYYISAWYAQTKKNNRNL